MMEDNHPQALCLVCCFSFRDTRRTGEGGSSTDFNLSKHKQFKLFCKQLELVGIGRGNGGGVAGKKRTRTKLITSSLLSLLDSPSCKGSLTVCPDCLTSISLAIDVRLKAEEVECRVRKLQQEILRELRLVQGHMEGYFGEVRKIEGTVRSSDVSCLEGYMDRKEGEEGMMRIGGRLRRDVGMFRDSIFKVVEELSLFQTSLDRITMTSDNEDAKSNSSLESVRVPVPVNLPNPERTKRSSRLHTKSTLGLKHEEAVVASPVPVPMSPSSPPLSPTISYSPVMTVWEGETLPVKLEVEIETEEPEEEFNHHPFLLDGNEDEAEAAIPSPENFGANQDHLEIFEEAEIIKEEEAIKNYHPDLLTDPPPQKNKKPNQGTARTLRSGGKVTNLNEKMSDSQLPPNRAIPQNSKRTLDNSPNLSKMKHFKKSAVRRALERKSEEDESDTGSNYSDSGSPPMKKKKVKEKASPTSSAAGTTERKTKLLTKRKERGVVQLHSNSKLDIDMTSVEFTNMGPFKKRMVCRALQKHSRLEEEDRAALNVNAERDITVEHNLRRIYYVKYHKEQDKLFIGDVELLVQEDLKTLQCSKCLYAPNPVEKTGKMAREHDMERYLVKHILAKHMDVFGCPLCGERLKFEWQYKAHLRTHKGLDNLTCSICGKPYSNNYNVGLHKWSHMSEEEKEEAKKNGMEDPRLKLKQSQAIASTVRFPCRQCGKTFKTEANLRQHEKTHDTRDQVICPKCGKQMLRVSYEIYHKTFACPSRDVELRRVKCLHCEMTFKNIMFMKRHIARAHTNVGVERPCICEFCGKGFKTKDCLWAHKQTHNDSKDWKCGKGCGREFNQRKNWKRHEASCKGASSGGLIKEEG